MNSFQVATPSKISSETTAGFDSGSTMRQNTPNQVQPSMNAASTSSRESPS